MKTVHPDGGSEFNIAFKVLEGQDVLTSRTTPYRPQSNGLVERSHGIVMRLKRTYLLESGLPLGFWNHAVKHVTDCKNAVITSVTGKVPYELLYCDSPGYLDNL